MLLYPKCSPIASVALALFLVGVGLTLSPAARAWQPAPGPLMTRWAKDVSPEKVHPEYPRPQMVREDWLNLNGLWDYAIVEKDAAQPAQWDGQILVPFPVESALSGVKKPVNEKQRLWYHRTFKVPGGWQGKRVLLHFGAVDWEATVTVNGKELGTHRGGYDGFGFDITDALKPGGDQTIVVAVWDPTDTAAQPHGKQVLHPGGIMYTATTGIWQTPWLEPVSPTWIDPLKITPDVDNSQVKVTALVNGAVDNVEIEAVALDGAKVVAKASGTWEPPLTLAIPQPKLWSPDHPFLYNLQVTVKRNGKVVDRVESYFGMRKIALGKDAHGVTRLMLNNQPLFEFGPLDQGFWPDGIYTAPTDEALRYDIEMTRKLGFNLARKHVKVEPERWYYWADKLGLLVWQDMPSGGVGDSRTDKVRPGHEDAAKQFETELKALVDGRGNHPCIVMWVPFNEGWGQYDTPRIVDFVKQLDPTRLVNNASGWTDRHAGDVSDMHNYPGPGVPKLEDKRAAVLGEFGGLGMPVKGHTWQAEKNWGYVSFKSSSELTDAYVGLIQKLRPLIYDRGLCAAVYTQTTDCEVEVNGLMTYDRAMVKADEATITAANKSVYSPPAPRHAEGNKLVPPAAPLVACDPYFSIWSPADKLTDADTVHWTGKPHRLTSLVRIDGKPFRVMGTTPATVPALPQTDLEVTPTRTIYTFAGAGVKVTLTFMTPALPDDLMIYSRPVTYVTWDAQTTDGKTHKVESYFDASAELTVNTGQQEVVHSQKQIGDLEALQIGSKDQPVLAKKGDDLRIDWGHLYVAAPKSAGAVNLTVPRDALIPGFIQSGAGGPIDVLTPNEAHADTLVASFMFNFGSVSAQPTSRWLMLAYDDEYSIQYFKHNLRPYWRRNGDDAAALLTKSAAEYTSLKQRCEQFDAELMADLTKAGGEKYARLCALAYRQCVAANKVVADDNGAPLMFPKENFSNGCIGTMDVIYPMAPQFLLFSPSLTKAMLVPILDYAASPRWRWPFAPHDLGTYPLANGQVYGGGERTEENQMPVEETGNVLILLAALAQAEGNADFSAKYWPVLEKWADYLKAKGFDPENQLCTDDFAGHLAHNVNLSAKAIYGLASFSRLCELRGDQAKATEYGDLAKDFAGRWAQEADDGGHSKLAFDKPGTWSQKYNAVWGRILGFGPDPSFWRSEMDFYKSHLNQYGLPLDSRKDYTKLDWTLWTATLTQDRADFDALVDPVFRFLNETPDRVPMTDWYDTKTGRHVGFQARSVVGGVFLQMLYDREGWKKWAGRDATKAANWAPLPTPPVVRVIVPTAREAANIQWRYTTTRPAEGWFKPDFDDRGWQQGVAGFGTQGTPGAVVRTIWNSGDIWLRRAFTLPDEAAKDYMLVMHHDEDAEVFLNGVPAATAGGYISDYEEFPLTAAAKETLKPGRNWMAIHCHQTSGGQYIDAGLSSLVNAPR